MYYGNLFDLTWFFFLFEAPFLFNFMDFIYKFVCFKLCALLGFGPITCLIGLTKFVPFILVLSVFFYAIFRLIDFASDLTRSTFRRQKLDKQGAPSKHYVLIEPFSSSLFSMYAISRNSFGELYVVKVGSWRLIHLFPHSHPTPSHFIPPPIPTPAHRSGRKGSQKPPSQRFLTPPPPTTTAARHPCAHLTPIQFS